MSRYKELTLSELDAGDLFDVAGVKFEITGILVEGDNRVIWAKPIMQEAMPLGMELKLLIPGPTTVFILDPDGD